MSIAPRLKTLVWHLCDQARRNAEYFERRRMAFAVIATFGFPFYYWVWHDLFPQPYENLGLRLLGSALFIPIIFISYWPPRWRPYLPAYWYAALLFALPFFFTFMFFKNNGSAVWAESTLVAVFVMVLLLDWLSMVIHAVVGIALAWLVYRATSETALDFAALEHLPIAAFAIVIGAVSNYVNEVVRMEQQRAMLATAGSIAHELRTPLLGIRSGAVGLRNYLPILIEAYRQARSAGLDVKPIRGVHLETMTGVLNRIESEANYSNAIIDMLIANVRLGKSERDERSICSLTECVEKALARYPFSGGEKDRVDWQGGPDILFRGSHLLMVHVVFNLLKNALRHISAAGKGEISIWFETLPTGGGRMFFRDTGSGIAPDVLPHIFQRFYSSPAAGESVLGSGIGLAFCRDVMDTVGGMIECSSQYGKYTEFALTFPRLSP